MPSADRAARLDAVTVDALGTIVELVDPVPALREALAARGVDRTPEDVSRAFAAEVAFYLPRAETGADTSSLAALRRECASVFLAEAGAGLDAAAFAPAFVAAIDFTVLPGAPEALGVLRSAGLALACVGNWDASLEERLEEAGLAGSFDAVVSSAHAGAAKPDPRIFELALARLGTTPERTLHIGDSDADREGAAAAGLAFEPVPLATLPERLGLR